MSIKWRATMREPVIPAKRSWSIEDIHNVILEHKTAERIWDLFGCGEIHPVIRDLIDRGIHSRSIDKSFRERELAYLANTSPQQYARRINIEAGLEAHHQAQAIVIAAKFSGEALGIMDNYAASVLAKFMFNGKELGMMNRAEVARAIIQRKRRSETEFKQSIFLEKIHAKMTRRSKVKDVIGPQEATAMWWGLERSDIQLTVDPAALTDQRHGRELM
jgi:hypothetical protein